MNKLERTTDEMFITLTLADRAKIVELCMQKQMCLTLVAKMMKISTQTVSKVLSAYIPVKNPSGYNEIIVLQSKIN